MPSTNGHGPRRAILYARVSSAERAKKGYSLNGQMEELRTWAADEGYQVVLEIIDPGEKRWTLDRPGMDRVRETVAGGGIDAVLAWRWDRFGESPWPEFLALEFEEYGTRLRSMDDSGEGEDAELLNGLKGLIAKRERKKTVERSRMGKMQRAREGKLLPTRTPHYGFRYNTARTNYVVHEEEMRVVRRIFERVGAQGAAMREVKRELEAASIPAPKGGRFWHQTFIRRLLEDDVYKPHTFAEVRAMVSEQVAGRLNPDQSYGIFWWGRRRVKLAHDKRSRVTWNDPSEWVAVPVPDAGVPRPWAEAARNKLATGRDRSPSKAARRFWELSGGIIRCGSCGYVMQCQYVSGRGGVFHYYRCSHAARNGRVACPESRMRRAEKAEGEVWERVSGFLHDPEELAKDFERMIELRRSEGRGNPAQESKVWAEKLAQVSAKRDGYLDLAASGRMTYAELDAKLADLEAIKEAAERELAAIRRQDEELARLETEKDLVIKHYAGLASDALEALGSEERHRLYGILRISVVAPSDGPLEVSLPLTTGVCETSSILAWRRR